ncbi:MAG: hypothetical protein H0T96_03135 [Thermoleophilaceae bacterium]|jgi:hypothetical protein|nr:hypothetical protein [Thermoleophilaceae bacterium]MDQ3240516.1 hypothetical protein [Actinomycetota bacterium]MDQ3355922.1 hypothetical protein [Actinomycetota bacterium]
MPFGETAELDAGWAERGPRRGDEAVRAPQAISFLGADLEMPRATAYAYLSAISDFVVSQVADGTKGAHGADPSLGPRPNIGPGQDA